METIAPKPRADEGPTSAAAMADPSIDDELIAWKRARKSRFAIPWRPLSLMASLCFGVASLVLPDWVNSAVQWPLFALAAASLYIGVVKRRSTKV